MYDFTKTRGNKELYEIIIQNAQKIGGKYFLNVPLQLIFVDPSYQRVYTRSGAKIKSLAANWDDNKMEPITLVAHPEEYLFACVDGLGRLMAKTLRASLYKERFASLTIEATIIFDTPTNSAERKVFEANLFATQCDEKEDLKHYQKHNANILRGIRENIILQNVCAKYGVNVQPHGRGSVRGGNLGDFTGALNICRMSNGEKLLTSVFEVISESGWSNSRSGYSKYTIQSLKRIIIRHAGQEETIIPFLASELVNMEPLQFKAHAIAKYPDRETTTAASLYLEDMIVENLGFQRTYFADKNANHIIPQNS